MWTELVFVVLQEFAESSLKRAFLGLLTNGLNSTEAVIQSNADEVFIVNGGWSKSPKVRQKFLNTLHTGALAKHTPA